jgi:heme exporter protein A
MTPQTLPPPGTPADAAPAPALELTAVSKRYGSRWALAHLSYRLANGRSLLLTGHNGSGKSTLLRILSTLTRTTQGTVQVLGWNANSERDRIREQVALLSHASFLYEDLTAEQNLSLLAKMLGEERPRDRVNEILSRVGLDRRGTSPVRQFSAGMKKRLSIGRLLMKRPRLALLDEPFGELDPAGIAQMEKLIVELKRSGTTVILATHLVEQGLTLCEERLHLEDGQQVAP